MTDDSDVYWLYVFSIEGGPTKVGQTCAPERRFKQIQAQTTGKLVLTGKWRIGQVRALATERFVHWLLRDHHMTGEWFNASEQDVLAAIDQALSTPLDPGRVIPALGKSGRIVGGEPINVIFPGGTLGRLRALRGSAGHSDLIREAVERELKRREREAKGHPAR